MPKGNKRKRKKKNKIKVKNIFVYLAVSAILTFLGSTYAWFTSSDTRVNNFYGHHLMAQITEVFTPEYQWQPTSDTTKEVRVKNTGPTPAVIRLSLKEYILLFEFDNTIISYFDMADPGDYYNGLSNITIYDNPTNPIVDIDDVTTWKAAADNLGTFKRPNGTGYYKAVSYQSSDIYTPKKGRTPGNTAPGHTMDDYIPANDPTPTGNVEYPRNYFQPTQPFNMIKLNFNTPNIRMTKSTDLTEKYWLYENGYFYYSQIVQPDELTEPLMNSLTLSEKTPNIYKTSLYKLHIFMDAHDTTQPVFNEWNIPNGEAHDMINNLITSSGP